MTPTSRFRFRALCALAAWLVVPACSTPPAYDVVIRGGTVYDGSGGAPITGDVAILGDSIVAIGTVTGAGRVELSAKGLAVHQRAHALHMHLKVGKRKIATWTWLPGLMQSCQAEPA